MKKLIATLVTGGLIFGAMATANAKPTQVWEDPADDATIEGNSPASLPGGWDLATGAIERKGKNILFTVAHNDMPPTGSFPEATRFLWNFTVGKTPLRLTVKSVDIGKPDVAAGQTTERVGRVDLQGHFRLEGECKTEPGVGVSFVNCPPLGYFDGSFDPSSMSFTAIIPMKALKAKPGSVIGPGTEQICTICWVSHYAERSLSTTVIDEAIQTKTYKVPR